MRIEYRRVAEIFWMMLQKGELCMKNLCLGCVLYPNPNLNPPMNLEHAQVSQEDQEKSDGVYRL